MGKKGPLVSAPFVVAVLTLTAGCSGEGSAAGQWEFAPPSTLPTEAPTNLLEGRRRIRDFVEDTRRTMFADYDIRERYSAPTSGTCETDHDGERLHDVSVRTDMPDDVEPGKLTRRVADYWESLGLPTSVYRDSKKSWEVQTRFYDDFKGELIVTTRGDGPVSVSAFTPCMSEPGFRGPNDDSFWPSLPPPSEAQHDGADHARP